MRAHTPSYGPSSPWHQGEQNLQASVGKREKMDAIGRKVLRDFLPDQHRDFYNQLPYIMTGSVDAQGQPWASVLYGEVGFVTSPSPTRLEMNARPAFDDPAFQTMSAGDGIGFLGIKFHTRRRNRVNGRIGCFSDAGFDVKVEQTMGNCVKYIQDRDSISTRDLSAPSPHAAQITHTLDEAAINLIRKSDSFFVASYMSKGGANKVDISHRGGEPGFVRVDENGVLTIPDFSGNLFFNTLENITLNGKAGLNFIDFETGDLLQMTGEAIVILDSPEIAQFAGAERLWTFTPSTIVRRLQALPFRWNFNELSPFVLNKGRWENVTPA